MKINQILHFKVVNVSINGRFVFKITKEKIQTNLSNALSLRYTSKVILLDVFNENIVHKQYGTEPRPNFFYECKYKTKRKKCLKYRTRRPTKNIFEYTVICIMMVLRFSTNEDSC